ncbi:hypothetical protein ACFE33_04880 [Falsihalocynthiibacter sp. SS001]|uniref:hypothetical protein n=1 Tax=Falsihalocynthiibacter sp. SS001 TaxID=3349698 RepID=UPI0036D21FA4
MSEHDKSQVDLDALFAAEMNDTIEPSADLMARVLADAQEVQKSFAAVSPASPRQSIWRGMLAAVGGWPTFAGLATATIAGVWLGVSPPQGIDTLTDTMLGNSFEYSDYLPSFDSVLMEG